MFPSVKHFQCYRHTLSSNELTYVLFHLNTTINLLNLDFFFFLNNQNSKISYQLNEGFRIFFIVFQN